MTLIHHLGRMGRQEMVRDLLCVLVDAIVEGGNFDDAVHGQLANVMRLLSQNGDDGPQQRVVEWLTRWAQPGEASLVADVLQQAHDASSARQEERLIPSGFVPLIGRLLEIGAAELRSSRRAPLVSYLVHAVRVQAPERLGAALLYFIHNERPGDCWLWEHENGLWPAIEASLAIEYRPDLAVDAIGTAGDAINRRGYSAILAPLSPANSYPISRRVLLQALADGRLPVQLEQQAISRALGAPPPDDLCFGSMRVLDLVLEQVGYAAAHTHHEAPVLTRWIQVLVPEYLRIHGMADFPEDGPAWEKLSRLTGYETTAMALGPIVRRFLAYLPGTNAVLAREIMDDGGGASPGISAALTVLSTSETTRRKSPIDMALNRDIHRQLEALIQVTRHERVFGVDLGALLGAAKRIELTKLDNDDKVRVHDDVLHVDVESIHGIASRSHPRDSALAIASLYVIHELFHVAQGIGDKDAVTRLRATGGETTLMHLDLTADHGAARTVSKATPEWSELWLKDLQGRSLDEFPARWTHTAASRARKAARLVGLRVDYLARQQGAFLATSIEPGYLFADYGPAGGWFLLMASGPPMTLLGSAHLVEKDSKVLASAADEKNTGTGGLEAVDALLLRLLTDVRGRAR